ncbi:MAG TPA: hypothetical protein VGM60_19515 [Pseudonocardia sp.]|jgi:hypothetical protein|uniref:hypothetical protein n=1 Tax=Pseudonocardia sp. TaxID=60912 RepID=UPI002F42C4A4
MKLYAELPGRAARQLLADVLALGWIAGFTWLAESTREEILRLRTPANALLNAGAAIGDAFAEAARTAARVPFFGAQLAAALRGGEAAGHSLSGVGAQQIGQISTLATTTGALVTLLGLMPPLALWLPLRVYYARTAGAAAAARAHDPDLLALRALTRVSVRRLHTVSEAPAASWRRSDPDVIRRLAGLELGRLGLRDNGGNRE